MVQVAWVQLLVMELGPSTVTVCPWSSLKQLPGGGRAASSWAMKLVDSPGLGAGADVDGGGGAKWCGVQGASPKSGAWYPMPGVHLGWLGMKGC